jgi:hypothetical protein
MTKLLEPKDRPIDSILPTYKRVGKSRVVSVIPPKEHEKLTLLDVFVVILFGLVMGGILLIIGVLTHLISVP